MNGDDAGPEENARDKIRDGIIGAIFGGGTAAMLMYATGEISWPIAGLMAAFSFWAAYKGGKAAIEWLMKLDEFDP